MIRTKPEQDVTKRKVGVYLFQSSVFHLILSMCACIVDVFIVLVALHFGLFYLTNYIKAVFMVLWANDPYHPMNES